VFVLLFFFLSLRARAQISAQRCLFPIKTQTTSKIGAGSGACYVLKMAPRALGELFFAAAANDGSID
jgi:hypothetical protein